MRRSERIAIWCCIVSYVVLCTLGRWELNEPWRPGLPVVCGECAGPMVEERVVVQMVTQVVEVAAELELYHIEGLVTETNAVLVPMDRLKAERVEGWWNTSAGALTLTPEEVDLDYSDWLQGGEIRVHKARSEQ